MPAAGDDITVHVEWLARRLTQQQEDAAATEQDRIMVSTHRVSRVPGHVRIPNPDAYTPGLVAIGPLHAKDAERRLRPGNRLKMAYLHSLISRGHPDPAGHLGIIQGYVRLAAAREREARAMYAAEDVDDVRAEDLIHVTPGDKHMDQALIAGQNTISHGPLVIHLSILAIPFPCSAQGKAWPSASCLPSRSYSAVLAGRPHTARAGPRPSRAHASSQTDVLHFSSSCHTAPRCSARLSRTRRPSLPGPPACFRIKNIDERG